MALLTAHTALHEVHLSEVHTHLIDSFSHFLFCFSVYGFLPACMSLHHMSGEVKKRGRTPRAGVTDGCQLLRGCWEL